MHLKQDTWCSKEFCSVELGDKRLNQRLLKVASDLLNNPTDPIHGACNNWSEAKAAYRLFNNHKLQEETILQKHQEKTLKRMGKVEDSVIFAIQDTTALNYTHHPKKKGINKINKNVGFAKPTTGFFLHNTLLMTENGLPLGLLDQKIYQHYPEEKTHHKNRPITQKQSFRWIEALRTTKSLCQQKTVVTIGDREADIFELFTEAEKLEAKVLIRATKDRILIKQAGQEHQTLWKRMKETSLKGLHLIQLPARHNQPERLASLEIRYAEITLKAPQRNPGAKEALLSELTMQAVWLYETQPPLNNDPLEWMLLTNIPISSIEDAIKMGKWYRLRWQIECYHRILKSGCKIEECRLETYDRLKKFVRIKSVIAFRLFWLTLVNRVDSEASSAQILEGHEWKALCCHITKNRQPPSKPPTVREAVRMIAKLGGFLGRKHDGEPGMTYIWRGWQKLTLIADFWLSICGETTYG